MGRRAGWSTDRSVSGAVLKRESSEPKHCTSDFTTPASGSPSPVPPTQEHDHNQDPGALLAVLAAALAQGARAPHVEAAFHCRLRRDAQVERRVLHELGVYYLVSGAQLAGWSRVGPQVTSPVCSLAQRRGSLQQRPRLEPDQWPVHRTSVWLLCSRRHSARG